MNKQKAYEFFQSGNLQEARKLCRQLVKKTPDDAQLWYLLGLINARSQHYKKAEENLLKALALDENKETFLSLGQVYLVTSQFEKAEGYFEKAIEFDASLVDAYVGLASLYGSKGEEEKSVEYYQKIIDMGAANDNIYGNLATLYERLRKNDLAQSSAAEALKLNSGNISAHLILSRQDRAQGDFEKSAERLNKLLNGDVHPSVVATVSAELGHTLDKKGDFKQAFAAYTRGKQATLKLVDEMPVNKNEYLDYINKNKNWYTEEKVTSFKSEIPSSSSASKAPVFFIGFPRSGTSLMEQILTSNPNIKATGEELLLTNLIRFAEEKSASDTLYPDVMAQYVSEDKKSILREEYLKKIRAACGPQDKDHILIDKLPLNLVDMGFVNQIFPESKIIVAYRDPRDVCLSCFMQAFKLNPAMIQFLTLKDTANFYAKTMDLWLHYKSVLNLDLIEYKYEDLTENFEKVSVDIVKFLGESWTPEMSEYHKHAATKKVSTPSFVDVTSPVYTRSVARWKNYEEEMAEVEEILKPYIDAFGYA